MACFTDIPVRSSIAKSPVENRSKQTRLKKEGNVLFNDALNTFFIYGYMASDIWLRTILIVRKETRCRHIGYSFQLTARVLLYATYHSLCYTSHGALAGMRNSSIYVMRQDNTIYKFSIKLSFSNIGQDKSELQKQISKLFILIAMAT